MRIFGYLSKEYGSAKFITYSLVLALLVLIYQPAAFALSPSEVNEDELHHKWFSHPMGTVALYSGATANSFYLEGAPEGLTVDRFSTRTDLRLMYIRFSWTGDISAETTFRVYGRGSGSNRLFSRPSSSDSDLGTITIKPTVKELRVSTPTNNSLVWEGSNRSSRFTVRLSVAPSETVTVAVSSSDATEGRVSPSELTFTTENYNVAQTVYAYGVRDNVHETSLTNWNVVLDPLSTDEGYNALTNVNVAMRTANVGPTVTMLVSHSYVFEGGGIAVKVRAEMDIDVPDAATTITVSASPGSGTSDSDFNLSDNTVLTIPAGERRSTGEVTITLVDNKAVGADKSVRVSGSVSNSLVSPISARSTTIVIYDDESRDSSLSNLVLSAGQLSPAFSSSTLRYTATVGPSVESLTVTPTSSSDVTDIRVNDESVSSGEASDSIDLALGENTISVLVVPRIRGHRQEYQILVTRGVSADRTPDEFSFAAVNDANPGSWVTSETITVAGLGDDLSAEILFSATGHRRIRGVLYVDGVVTDGREGSDTRVTNGQEVAVGLLTSEEFGGTATGTVTIGGVSTSFTVTTRGDPATPDAFSFAAVNNVEPSTSVASNAITVSGLDEGVEAKITISGGGYFLVDGIGVSGALATNGRTRVTNGQQVVVRVVSHNESGETATATLTIGNVSSDFTVTTRGGPATPDAFSFAERNDVVPGSTVTSNTVTVSSLGDGLVARITVVGGSAVVNGNVIPESSFVEGIRWQVTNGDRVAVSVVASDEPGGTATATVTIGVTSANFTVTTRGDPARPDVPTPDVFSFAAVSGAEPGSTVTSNAVTISGLDEGVETAISVSGGTLVVSDSDSETTVTNGVTTVTNGQRVTVSVVASDVPGGTTTATVTLGNASANFTVTTRGTSSTDQTPDVFSFTAVSGVEPGSTVTSNAVTVSGLGEGVAAEISATGSTSLLVNGNEFTGAPVTNGQRVAVSVVASSEFGGTATATVTIGGVSANFTVTTRGTSTNADLGSLSFSPSARLSPSFSGGTVSYTASVSDQLSTITILATPAHSDASVSITPADAQASTSGHQVNLITGLGTATIVVTAEDNRTRKTYTVRFTPLETAPAPVIEELEEEIVTEVSREVTSNTLQAITGRIGSAVGNVPAPVAPPTVGGLLPVLKIFDQHSRDTSSTRSTLHQSLDGANFVLSLTEGKAGQDGGEESPGGAAIWGSADYRNMSGGKNGTVNWDGGLFSVHVGTDALLESGLLVGLSASVSRGTFDYFGGQSSTRGQLKTRMTSLYPYLGWTVSERLNLWMTAGYGQGRIEYNNETYLPFANDTSLATAAFGSRYRLSSDERNMPGDSIMVDLKTEAWGTRLTVKGNEARPAKSSIRTHGVRLAIEGSRERETETGATVTPFGELGVRWDGGDGETGTGVEVGGGLKLLTSCRCMTVDAGARILATHESGRKEWGVSLSVRRDLSRDRTGMSYGASLSHGEIDSKIDSLWESRAAGRVKETERLTTRLAAEVGYGLYGADGIYTPYAGLGLMDNGSRDYAVGIRYAGEAAMSMGLELNRLEKTDKSPDHRIMLTGQMDW